MFIFRGKPDSNAVSTSHGMNVIRTNRLETPRRQSTMHNSGIIWNLFKILETGECLQETLRENKQHHEVKEVEEEEWEGIQSAEEGQEDEEKCIESMKSEM
jgi:hypothetical protein